MINADYVFHGTKINVNVRVGAMSYMHNPKKKWIFNVSLISGSEVIPITKVYSVDYIEGQDPIKQAYEEVKASGDFTNITEFV